MEKSIYPKVLIIGETFHRKSGGGITLSNLFHDWPKSKLFNANDKFVFDQLEVDRCDQYYQFGNLENKYPLPYRLRRFIPHPIINNSSISGVIKPIITSRSNQSTRDSYSRLKVFFKNILLKISIFTGVYPVLSHRYCSSTFLAWVEEIKPDYVYTQLSDINSIRFIKELTLELNIPLCIHIMDDWPSTYSRPGILYYYWKYRIDREFRELIAYSTVCLSISEGMSREYKLRYDREFIPFHNPIDLNLWEPYCKKDLAVNNNEIRLLYAGRISEGVTNSLIDVIEVIESMLLEGIPVKLYLQSPKAQSNILESFINRGIMEFNPRVDYNNLPKLFSQYDVLVLPYDFNKRGSRFIKYSMPTKASEFMITGVPILLYSPSVTNIHESAAKNNWALTVSQRNKSLLKKSLHEIIFNNELRKKISSNAIDFATQNYDAFKVRKAFLEAFVLLKNDER